MAKLLSQQVVVVFQGASESKGTDLDIVNGSFSNLCALALGLALHIFALHSANDSQ